MKVFKDKHEESKELSLESRKQILLRTQINDDMSYEERLAQIKSRYL